MEPYKNEGRAVQHLRPAVTGSRCKRDARVSRANGAPAPFGFVSRLSSGVLAWSQERGWVARRLKVFLARYPY